MRLMLVALVAVGCGGSVDTPADPVDASASDTSVTDTAETAVPGGSIKCGMGTCDSATQECCIGLSGSKCVARGGCGGGSSFTCSDSTVCKSGEVCCADRNGSVCATGCAGYVLCSDDKECKADQRCVTGLLGFKYCRSPSMMGDGGWGGWEGGMRPDAPSDGG